MSTALQASASRTGAFGPTLLAQKHFVFTSLCVWHMCLYTCAYACTLWAWVQTRMCHSVCGRQRTTSGVRSHRPPCFWDKVSLLFLLCTSASQPGDSPVSQFPFPYGNTGISEACTSMPGLLRGLQLVELSSSSLHASAPPLSYLPTAALQTFAIVLFLKKKIVFLF